MNATQEVHAAEQTTKSKDGRKANGRFAPGNPGGPGNPYARQVGAMRKMMVYFFNEDRMRELAFILYEKASRGDMAAMKLIFQFVMGKPPEAVDPDRLDIDEWQKLQELARPPQEMSKLMNGVPAQLACNLTNITWPCKLETTFTGPLRDGLKAMDEHDAKAAAPKANGENGRSPTVAGVSDPGYSGAPKGNGDNGAASSRGVAPLPILGVAEDEEWLRRIARELFADEPKPNGTNGRRAQRKE